MTLQKLADNDVFMACVLALFGIVMSAMMGLTIYWGW